MLCAFQSRAEAAASCLESKCPHSVGEGDAVGVSASSTGPVCMTFRSGRGAGGALGPVGVGVGPGCRGSCWGCLSLLLTAPGPDAGDTDELCGHRAGSGPQRTRESGPLEKARFDESESETLFVRKA